MGCDIHLQVQRRNSKGKWKTVEKLPARACSWCSGTGKNKRDESCFSCSGTGTDTTPYDDRNYTTFGVLAGVRNYDVTPIAHARGLPDGMDNDSDYYGDHSFTWLTLAELLAHDWGHEIEHGGLVNAPTYVKWMEAGRRDWPEEWCQGTSGTVVSIVEMQALIAKGEATPGHYTKVTWTKTLADSCMSFCQFMESLRTVGEPEDVRIVFGFDN
jgi:hypothetical protein